MDILRQLELLYIRFLCSDIEKYINEISQIKLKTKKGKIIKQTKDFGKYNQVIEEFKKISKDNFTKEEYQEILRKINTLEIREVKAKSSKIKIVISLAYYDAKKI